MFVMRDEKGPDEKILCVPAHDPRHAHVRDIGDVPTFEQLEISHFFEVYKDLEPGKSVEGSHWTGREQAYEEIEASGGGRRPVRRPPGMSGGPARRRRDGPAARILAVRVPRARGCRMPQNRERRVSP